MSDQVQAFDKDDYGDDDDEDNSLTPDGIDSQIDQNSDVCKDSSSEDEESEGASSQQQDKLIDKQQYIQLANEQQPYPISNKIKVTNPIISKYQKALIIGKRANQISNNSPIYIQIDWNNPPGPMEIAEIEYQEGKIPFIIRRYLPNGQFQDWKFQQLIR